MNSTIASKSFDAQSPKPVQRGEIIPLFPPLQALLFYEYQRCKISCPCTYH
jgi:hypothetical protein